MPMVPTYTHFILTSPLEDVPAGATGQLTRLDSYHVALAFDKHEDRVLDITDTPLSVWTSIRPHSVSPSLTDPPCNCWRRLAIAASLAVAFLIGVGVAQAESFTLW